MRSPRGWLVAPAWFALASACGEGGEATPGNQPRADASSPPRARAAVVDPEGFRLVSPGEDPFDDRPEGASCDGGAAPEILGDEPAFGVDTGTCAYGTFRARARVPIARGEHLELRIWHFALDAVEPAVAHVAVQIDDEIIYDARIPIPSPGALLASRSAAAVDHPEGAPVYFHLHNHGRNSWAFVELSRRQ